MSHDHILLYNWVETFHKSAMTCCGPPGENSLEKAYSEMRTNSLAHAPYSYGKRFDIVHE